MYSVVLLMALSGGAETTAADCAGCYGGGCNGGGCHGGGGLFHRGGHGCHGCNGGCHGCNGGYGCNGGCYGAAACAGAAGCAGCAGAPAPAPAPMPAPAPDKKKKTSGEDEANLSAPATVIVSLPAEATLKVDDYLTTSKSATRLFVTPSLNRGQEFSYTLTGEIVRDGKPVVATKRISVRAGEETRVAIEFPETVASK